MLISSGGRLSASAAGFVVCAVVLTEGCMRHPHKVDSPAAPTAIEELWQSPEDIKTRNLYYGPGGADLAPRETSFAFVSKDDKGFSPGLDVRDSAGREWDVKLGPESQTEVVTSRILWAIGFHQPATYYLERWTMTGAESGIQPPGRFRPVLPEHQVAGDWSWYENPFVGTRPFGGLIVANLMLNSWDWKTANNKIYHVHDSAGGVHRRYVVRDLGASLGKTRYPAMLKFVRVRGIRQGTRNDLPGFESQGFIRRIEDDGRIDFDYTSMYRDLIETVTIDDVRWACGLLAQLSDAQWHDAFRAGGFSDDQRARYVRKIKEKITQGLTLAK
jgi:hypothetical protein